LLFLHPLVLHSFPTRRSSDLISSETLEFAGLAALLMAAFVMLESRIANPIMPPRILGLRGLIHASAVRGFLVTGMYSTFFLGTLDRKSTRLNSSHVSISYAVF